MLKNEKEVPAVLHLKSSRLRILFPLLTVLWFAFILARSLKNGVQSDSESGLVRSFLQGLFPGITMHFVRKLAHFLEYFLLGGLLLTDFRLYGRRSLFRPALLGLLAAGTDELVQRFVPQRSGELLDVLLDFSGVLTGILTALGLWALAEKRKRGKEGKRRD